MPAPVSSRPALRPAHLSRFGAAVLLVLGAAAATGCAGGSTPSASPPAASETPPPPAAPPSPPAVPASSPATEPSPPAATVIDPPPAPTVTVDDFAYDVPASVPPGATVVVANVDVEAHTLTATGEGGFAVTVPVDGQGTFVAPTAPGRYPFVCLLHGGMEGVLTVG